MYARTLLKLDSSRFQKPHSSQARFQSIGWYNGRKQILLSHLLIHSVEVMPATVQKQSRWRKKGTLFVMIFLGLILAGIGVYSSVPTASSNWSKYSNEEFGFSIHYPEGWKYDDKRFFTPYKTQGRKLAVGFGVALEPRPIGAPRTSENSPTWSVSAIEDVIDLDSSIAFIGTDSTNRSESREDIRINGIPATLITITRGQPAKRTLIVLIEHKNRTYLISNGSYESEEFTTFYNTFSLMK